jgi:hypothetical protein
MPTPPTKKVFISYRRVDSRSITLAIRAGTAVGVFVSPAFDVVFWPVAGGRVYFCTLTILRRMSMFGA